MIKPSSHLDKYYFFVGFFAIRRGIFAFSLNFSFKSALTTKEKA